MTKIADNERAALDLALWEWRRILYRRYKFSNREFSELCYHHYQLVFYDQDC